MLASTALIPVEYAKAVAYIVSGISATRLWFRKEIAAGKAELKKVETAVVSAEKKVVADVKKIV